MKFQRITDTIYMKSSLSQTSSKGNVMSIRGVGRFIFIQRQSKKLIKFNLKVMGQHQPSKSIKINNSKVGVIITDTIKNKRTKSIDMRLN